ncbi:MAG TPA: DNA-formamidopyrimidine glycosylase family protein [Solirubrobacterales bacterium]|nr:DNA-formamidopyrimidine glycosylase family protein [Solirubrobacterales bacterium]
MPEGDTIHRAARQLNLALGGREIGLAEAPNPRSPLHRRAAELQGRTLEHAEARGKHLLVHFSGGVVLHTHLGMNGKVFVVADGRRPYGKPWWTLASGRSIAAQTGAKLLRLTSETRARNDPALIQLGPDPLVPGFDVAETAVRMRRLGAGREIGAVVLDQGAIAGIGNAIRCEALFRARISPFRPVDDLSEAELELVVAENEAVMRESMAKGRRPRAMYRARRCPNCGGEVSSRGQGDDNRTAYWCPGCQS